MSLSFLGDNTLNVRYTTKAKGKQIAGKESTAKKSPVASTSALQSGEMAVQSTTDTIGNVQPENTKENTEMTSTSTACPSSSIEDIFSEPLFSSLNEDDDGGLPKISEQIKHKHLLSKNEGEKLGSLQFGTDVSN